MPCRIRGTFGGFTSGIGIHYDNSVIVNSSHQGVAKNLVVGQRMLPNLFIRAADSRPVNVHDMLPADTRFKILVFTGNTSDNKQLGLVQELAKEMEPILARFGKTDMFDVLSLSSAKKGEARFTDLPMLFREHWTKVLLDDVDARGQGGKAYHDFGVGSDGAVVLVRPDGYIGMVLPFNQVGTLEEYLSGFLIGT